MRARKMVAKGFTLVEILIVVVILGILAAIVIPQFTNASESAKFSSTVSQLQTIRSQMELYSNQHNDNYPDIATDWTQLTLWTDIQGNTFATQAAADAAVAGGTPVYGPYLQKDPNNPFTDTADVAAAAAANVGWVWDGTTLRASMDADKALELDADANDVATY